MSSSSSQDSTSSQSSSQSSSAQSEAPKRGVRFRRYAQSRFVINNIDGFRFRVVAYGAFDMPNEIFRYIRRPYNPTTGAEADEFDGVCSSVDLQELPAGAPTGVPPYFRLDEIDVVFRTRAEADEAWSVLQTEFDALLDSLNAQDELGIVEDIVIGSPPESDPPE